MNHTPRYRTALRGLRALARFTAIGLVAPSMAHAQSVSDLMPAEPAPASPAAGAAPAFNNAWSPGMPLPRQPGPVVTKAATRSAAEAGEAGTPPGPEGDKARSAASDLSRYVFDDNGGDVLTAPDGDGAIPETHLVQRGDTLWDLSSSYFRNPWEWPKLWALNPLITNPHWIYPGDVVRLRLANADAAPSSASNAPQGMQITRTLPNNFTLRQNGFIEQTDLAAAAKIIGSREEKIMLAMLDEAYVEFTKDQPLSPGERYSIYHVVEDVKGFEGRKIVGSIVEVVGEVEVRSVTGGRVARAVVVDATNPIERGYRVGPLKRQFKLVDPVGAKVDLDAVVVATLRPQELLGEQTLVFLDKGKEQGLEVGNRLVMVRRGDGYRPVFRKDEKDDARFPREVLGEILLVEVRGKTATGVVSRATKEVRIGEKLEARKGY